MDTLGNAMARWMGSNDFQKLLGEYLRASLLSHGSEVSYVNAPFGQVLEKLKGNMSYTAYSFRFMDTILQSFIGLPGSGYLPIALNLHW